MTATIDLVDDGTAVELERPTVLYVTGASSNDSPRAFVESLETASALTEVLSLAAALEQLREASFDVVLIEEDATTRGPAEIMSAIRSSSSPFQAVLILSFDEQRRRAVEFLAAGVTDYLSVSTMSGAEWHWQLCRAAQFSRTTLLAHRLQAAERQRSTVASETLMELLTEAAALVAIELPVQSDELSRVPVEVQRRLEPGCRDLLQAYLLLGREHLTQEIGAFAHLARQAGLPLSVVLRDFLRALTSLVQDRADSSARRVVDRAHLLLLELLLKWKEGARA